jgi:hypothetical protein
MKSLAALALSLAVMATAAPVMAQPSHGHEGRGGYGGHEGYAGQGGGRGGGAGGPRWEGGDRRGGGGSPYGEPARGGYYADPRGGYPAQRNYGGYPAAPRSYGYAPQPAPRYAPRGPDSLGADWGGQQDEVRAGVRQGRYIGLARVIGSIRQRTPGRQLDAGLEQWGGRAVYRVRWAEPGGRRTDYIVDAQSGAILHVDGR